ncbi:MAG: hypothetical protein Q8S20_15700 [Sulfuritalea sp.]|nr:hypothetical protein [Sulfuritalea sp.]
MTIASEKIAGLLHQTRSPSWTSDNTVELSAAIKNLTADEAHLALLSFCRGMLTASRSCLLIRRDAAMLEDIMAERDESGRPPQ